MSVSTTVSSLRERTGRSGVVRFVHTTVIRPLVACVRERPLQTLGVALGAGIMLGSGARKPVVRLMLLAVASRLIDQA